VSLNWFDYLPDLFRAGVNFNRNFDNAHRLVSVVSL
jgi:hypothetical protein